MTEESLAPLPRVSLLGVPVDAVTQEEAIARMRGYLSGTAQYHVVTPNSEMLVEAARNPAFHAVLQKTSLNLPDSHGLLWMAFLTGQKLKERVTGVDTVTAFCSQLTADDSVFFLGAAPGVAEKAAAFLQLKNPNLQVVGTYSGSPRGEDAGQIVSVIQKARPAILFVAYGAPAQDMWIDEHMQKLPSVRVAMGVGGTFDFLAGVARRAPVGIRNMHLEWLWRVALEPWRIKRIWTAVVVFPWLVVRHGKGLSFKLH